MNNACLKINLQILWSIAMVIFLGACGEGLIDSKNLEILVSKVAIEASKRHLTEGETLQLSAKAINSDKSRDNLTPTEVSWKSLDENIATISNSGIVEAITVGEVTIELNFMEQSTRLVLTIAKIEEFLPLLLSVNIITNELSIEENSSQQLVVEAEYDNIEPIDITNQVSWDSSDKNIAWVDNTGLLHATAIGSANIIANFDGLDSDPLDINVFIRALPVDITPLDAQDDHEKVEANTSSAKVFIDVTKTTDITPPTLDKEPPTISNTEPARDQVNVDSNSKVDIRFSEAIKNASLIALLRVNDGTSIIPGVARLSDQNKVLTFIPTIAFSPNTTYQVTVSGAIEDIADNQLGTTYRWKFTTKSLPVIQDPIAQNDHFTTTINTPLINQTLLLNDSDPDKHPILIASMETKSKENGSISPNADGTFNYSPAIDFLGTDSFDYTISNNHGGYSTATVLILVLKAPELIGPIVKKTLPTSSQKEVSVNSQISVTFDGYLALISRDQFQVSNDTSAISGKISSDGKIAIFTPDKSLAYETTYTVTLKSNIKNQKQGILGEDFSWTFTTEIAPEPNTTPIDVSDNLPLTETISGNAKIYYVAKGLQAKKTYNVSLTALNNNIDLSVWSDEYQKQLCQSKRDNTLDDACFASANGAGELYLLIDSISNRDTEFQLDIQRVKPASIRQNIVNYDYLNPLEGNAYYAANLFPRDTYLIKLRELPEKATLKVYRQAFSGAALCEDNPSTKEKNCVVRDAKEIYIQVDGISAKKNKKFKLEVRHIENISNKLPYFSSVNQINNVRYLKVGGFDKRTQYTLSLTEMNGDADLHVYNDIRQNSRLCNSKRVKKLDESCFAETNSLGEFYIKVLLKETSAEVNFRLDINPIVAENINDSYDGLLSARYGNYHQISGLEPKSDYAIGLEAESSEASLTIFETALNNDLCTSSLPGDENETCIVQSNSAGELFISVQGPGNVDPNFTLDIVPINLVKAIDSGSVVFDNQLRITNGKQIVVSGLNENKVYAVETNVELDHRMEEQLLFDHDQFFSYALITCITGRNALKESCLIHPSSEGLIFVDDSFLLANRYEVTIFQAPPEEIKGPGLYEISNNDYADTLLYKITGLAKTSVYQVLATVQEDQNGMALFTDQFFNLSCRSHALYWPDGPLPGEFCTSASNSKGEIYLYLPNNLLSGNILEILTTSIIDIDLNTEISDFFTGIMQSNYFKVEIFNKAIEVKNLGSIFMGADISVYRDKLFSNTLCYYVSDDRPCILETKDTGKEIYIKVMPDYDYDATFFSFSVIEKSN